MITNRNYGQCLHATCIAEVALMNVDSGFNAYTWWAQLAPSEK